LTEQSGIRCPKCGAYLTGKIAEGVSYATCPYCNTTLLIPKKETLTRAKYGKTTRDMSREEIHARFLQIREENEQKLVTQLEQKRKEGGLTAKEERQLSFYTRKSRDASFKPEEFCLPCYREARLRCVNCGRRTCGNSDCDSTLPFLVGRNFSLYCPNCGGYVCRECNKSWKDSFLGKKYYCPKCRTELEKKTRVGK
jgi:predicted RNA-binding Zn-ribbon protein involved in translation (DUF1610 family)